MSNGAASSSSATNGTRPAAGGPLPRPAEPPLRPLYEESSQFRHWRFSKEQLVQMRRELNERAVNVVRTNLLAEKAASEAEASSSNPPAPSSNASSSTSVTPTTTPPGEINYLTVEDELALIAYYISTVPKTCAGFGFNATVEATTILFLKRFYLLNTCMDYHPRKIMPTCLFLALKAENNLVPIDHFISRFSKLSAAEVLSNEFLVAQSLGFEFKVHHAHVALHGFFLDFQSLPADSLPAEPPLASLLSSASQSLSTLSLPLDLPLMYTPSQIALGAIAFQSEEHVRTYLKHKETISEGKLKAATVLAVVEEIVAELRAEETRLVEDEGGKKRLGRVKEVDRRLRSCGNPEKVAGTALYRKRQREEEAEETAKRAKKAAKTREAQKKDEDIFGGELVVIPQTEEGTRAVLEDVPGGMAVMGDGVEGE